MIDLHSHILPGVDDGARTLGDSVELARAAVADGIEAIAATPHVRDDYPTEAATMERLVEEVEAALAEAAVPLRVLRGGEVALDRLDRLDDDELRRFGLGGSRYVLLEFPYRGWPLELEEIVFRLLNAGFGPVLAHPERNAEVQGDPERLARVVRSGALVQLTAASLDGRLGRPARAAALALLELELAHLVASDAHTPAIREVGLSRAREVVGDAGVAAWLTGGVPAAIVANEAIPPRPEAAPRAGLLGRLRRR